MAHCEQKIYKELAQEEEHILSTLSDFYRQPLPYQYCLITRQDAQLETNLVLIQLKNIRETYKKYGNFEIALIDGILSPHIFDDDVVLRL